MDPLLGNKSAKTKYNVKLKSKIGSTVWGIPFDFRKKYTNENPLHGSDVVELSPNDSFFNASFGSGFELTNKTITTLFLVLLVATACIIYGALENVLMLILGIALVIYFFAEFASRCMTVFYYGYAHFEVIPSILFKNKFLATLTWKLQIFGVSSILSLMGAMFVAHKGWEFVLFWIFFSSLTAYPISGITNLMISSRHFDTTLVELSTRFGGFYPKYVALTMNYIVQLVLYSTFGQLFALILDTYPIAIVGVMFAFGFQIILGCVYYFPFNSLKFMGIFVQITAGVLIYLFYYLIANSVGMESFIEAFNTHLCYDTAVNPAECYFGSRQIWNLAAILFTFICSELPSRYTQFGRFSLNGFFLFIFTIFIILATFITGTSPIKNTNTVGSHFDVYSFSDVLVSVPFATVTGLLLTHGNQSSSHYIKKVPTARIFADHTIVIEAIYAIVFLFLASGISVENPNYKAIFASVVDNIGSLLDSSFSLPASISANVFASMISLHCLNTMESLSRGMSRSLSSYKSLEKDIKDKEEYPEVSSFSVNPLTSPIKFLLITIVPVVASYASIFEIFWNLSGIFSLIFVSYAVIIGGFYSGLLTQSKSQIVSLMIIGTIFNTLGIFCAICLDAKLFDETQDILAGAGYNWIVFLFTLIAYAFFLGNYYLAYKAITSYTVMSHFPRFVRSSRVERRVGFFRNRNYTRITESFEMQ